MQNVESFITYLLTYLCYLTFLRKCFCTLLGSRHSAASETLQSRLYICQTIAQQLPLLHNLEAAQSTGCAVL